MCSVEVGGGGVDDSEALRSCPAVKGRRVEAGELVFGGLKRQLMEVEQIFCLGGFKLV